MNWFYGDDTTKKLVEKLENQYKEKIKMLEEDLKKKTDNENILQSKFDKKDQEIQNLKILINQIQKENQDIKKENDSLNYGMKKENQNLDYYELEKKSYTGVIDIDSIKNFQNGWKIYDFSGSKVLQEKTKSSKVIVSSLGNFNKGKTFINSRICNVDLHPGTTLHTRGISIKELDGEQNIWILDTSGFQTPINTKLMKKEDIPIKNLDEDFMTNIVLEISDIFLFVVEHMNRQEQEILQKIKNIVSSRGSESSQCHIYVIHNFADVFTMDEGKKLWEQEITDIYEGEFKEETKTSPAYFFEEGNAPIRHFCIWNDSFLKEKNDLVFKFIREAIPAYGLKVNKNPFLQRLQKAIDKVIPNYIPLDLLKTKEEKSFLKFEETTDEKEVQSGVIGRFKPNDDVEKLSELNRYLEGFSGTTMTSMLIHYDEILEDDCYKIYFDTPGLDAQKEKEKKLTLCQGNIMKPQEFKTRVGDTIRVGIMKENDGNLQIFYEREIVKTLRRNISRPEGKWTKKIELPNDYRNFSSIVISPGAGLLIIKIPKKVEVEVKDEF